MKKVMQVTHHYTSVDEVEFALAGQAGIPGYITAYATHSQHGQSTEPDTVVTLAEVQDMGVLPKGMRYVWLSDAEYARLKAA